MTREEMRERVVDILHQHEYKEKADAVSDQCLFDLTDRILDALGIGEAPVEGAPTRCPHCAKPYTYAMCLARSPNKYECTLAPSHAGEHMAEGPNGHVHAKW